MKFQQAKNPSSGGRLLPLRGFSRPRGGLTLIEILMTIFVLAIGLLGVAALLPVGTFQMRQGQIAQRSAEIGSGALDTIEASGINHPGRWSKLAGAFPDGAPFDAVDITDLNNPVRIACRVINASVVIPSDPPDPPILTVTVASSLPATVNFQNSLIGFVRCQKPTVWDTQWRITGGTFTADYLGDPTNTDEEKLTPVVNDVFVIKRYEPFAIDPLYVAAQGAAPEFAPNIERLTLLSGVFGEQDPAIPDVMQTAAAEAIFQATDDLLFTPGTDAEGIEDESKPPEPPWPPKVDAEGRVSPRPSLGNYSWLATFVPVEQSGGYQDGCTYTVSVAVFYKRPLQLPSSEKTLDIGGSSTRLNCRIEIEASRKDDIFEDNGTVGTWERDVDEKHIKSGLWGLVTYTDAHSTERARWYRLGSVGEPVYDSGTDTWGVSCRLIGPDFPTGWTNLGITFYEGLVAVFERTMRVPELPLGEAAP